jgi:hypothetical protein
MSCRDRRAQLHTGCAPAAASSKQQHCKLQTNGGPAQPHHHSVARATHCKRRKRYTASHLALSLCEYLVFPFCGSRALGLRRECANGGRRLTRRTEGELCGRQPLQRPHGSQTPSRPGCSSSSNTVYTGPEPPYGTGRGCCPAGGSGNHGCALNGRLRGMIFLQDGQGDARRLLSRVAVARRASATYAALRVPALQNGSKRKHGATGGGGAAGAGSQVSRQAKASRGDAGAGAGKPPASSSKAAFSLLNPVHGTPGAVGELAARCGACSCCTRKPWEQSGATGCTGTVRLL